MILIGSIYILFYPDTLVRIKNMNKKMEEMTNEASELLHRMERSTTSNSNSVASGSYQQEL